MAFGLSLRDFPVRAFWAVVILASVCLPPGALRADSSQIAAFVRAVDGDTVVLSDSTGAFTVRLEGIDAPELQQPHSQQARRWLTAALQGKQIVVAGRGRDRFGRLLGRLLVNGLDLSAEAVRTGHAWHFKQYSSDRRLATAEVQARAARIGLWSETQPMAPWDYRNRGARPSESGLSGNVRSNVYHTPRCRHYSCKNCTRHFSSARDAQVAGYRPHKDCVD